MNQEEAQKSLAMVLRDINKGKATCFSFKNSVDVGVLAEGVEKFEDTDLNYRIEWRLRTKPFAGMKQPTPNGGFFGNECILIIAHDGLRAANLSLKLIDGDDCYQLCTDHKGEVRCPAVVLSSWGEREYKIEIIGYQEQ